MDMKRRSGIVLVAAVLCEGKSYPCKIAHPVSNVDMVRDADAIVRANAESYAVAPQGPISSTGFDVSHSTIRFKVSEVIRGKLPAYLILPGTLVESDDFNDQPLPYSVVRPEGRKGSCFADSYRSGGQFLLILKKQADGEFTVRWYPLAPVNEQLHSPTDPWLLWVRKQSKSRVAGSAADQKSN